MRTIKILLSFLFLVVITTRCQSQAKNGPNTKSQELTDGASVLVLGSNNPESYEEAGNLLDSAIGLDSSNYSAYVMKAQVLSRFQHYSEAIALLEVLERRMPFGELELFLGALYQESGQAIRAKSWYDTAAKSFDSSRRQNPGEGSTGGNHANLILARLLSNQDRKAASRDMQQQVTELSKKHPEKRESYELYLEMVKGFSYKDIVNSLGEPFEGNKLYP